MRAHRLAGDGRGLRGLVAHAVDFNFSGVVHAQRQLIAVDAKLHRVAHGRVFDERDERAGDDAHIKKMLAQRALAADGADDGRLADGKLL